MLDRNILGLTWEDQVQSEGHAGADFYGALNMAAFQRQIVNHAGAVPLIVGNIEHTFNRQARRGRNVE